MKVFKVSLVVACAAMVAACGGGGGENTTSPAAQPPTATSVPLVQNPVLPGASVSSQDVAAFNLLNSERDRCGFGKLNWNDQLATAARSHADWQLVNNYLSHQQIAATPGFTGIEPEDRIVAAGYASTAGAFIAADESFSLNFSNATNLAGLTNIGVESIRGLLSAPYHLLGMVGSYVDIGIGVRNSDQAGSTTAHGKRVAAHYNLAYKTSTGYQSPTSPASNEVRTYPCSGTTGTAYQLQGESPNPVPGRDLSTNPIGHPILIESPIVGAALVITSVSITPSGGSAVSLLPTMTQTSDTNTFVRSNQAIVLPNLPLAASTAHTVNISGTVNGNAFNRSFTFTTGS